MKITQLVITLFITFLLQNCSRNNASKRNSLNEFDEINTEIRVDNINVYLTKLEYNKDSLFYRERREEFGNLLKENSIDFLKTYIQRLKVDFENKEFLLSTFKKQIKCLEDDCEKMDAQEMYQRIIEVEEQLYKHYVKIVPNINGIDKLVSSIAPFKNSLVLGEQFNAMAGVYAYNQDGRKWPATTNIYYIDNHADTVLVKSYSDILSDSTSAYLDISFKPMKKGNYFVRGSFLIFIDYNYFELPYETIFTVK